MATNISKLLRNVATTSDITDFSIEINTLTNKALAKGLERRQIAIILSTYIRVLLAGQDNKDLLSEIAIAEIRKPSRPQ